MPASSLQKIQRFVVLMLENRSFDHLLGNLQSLDKRVAGIAAAVPGDASGTGRIPATRYTMPFDPGHEFEDVQIQLYGLQAGGARLPNPPVTPAPMSGFVSSAQAAAQTPHDAQRVMEYFTPKQIPVLATLAGEFAVCNFWYASVPGPTWPNRFFVHAASSGGLTASPDEAQAIRGYSFQNQTIFERLGQQNWRIYHDGLPQAAGINSLRIQYVDPFTENFRHMSEFAADVAARDLPAYTFIEPAYDTGHNYVHGNSMHPLNDIREGETLIKQVYETLRNSPLWQDTMLIVVFDEHGGFYDHVPPAAAPAPGDTQQYASPGVNFGFDLLGVRVPALVVSAYTQRNTVIGTSPDDPGTRFDHTSVLATVEQRFGLAPLTERDKAANSLATAINLESPRLAAAQAPTKLPMPARESLVTRFLRLFERTPPAARADAPLSSKQHAFVGLALACDLQLSADPAQHAAIHARRQAIHTAADAAAYISEVENRIRERRKTRR
jgi:phospholipase C